MLVLQEALEFSADEESLINPEYDGEIYILPAPSALMRRDLHINQRSHER